MSADKKTADNTIASYLLSRLGELGCRHVFGIPGDFILPLFDQIVASDLQLISMCNELNAGYAADGYARLAGLGAVAVTYGPGALSTVNAVAGAYTEHVPIVVISGAPETGQYAQRPLLHHVLHDRYEASVAVFEPITVDAQLIRDPDRAREQIDRALEACVAHSLPIYLEIARDLQLRECAPPGPWRGRPLASDPEALAQAVERISALAAEARTGAILPGHLIQRAGLERQVIDLMEHTGYAAATMLVGKADYLEYHPRCIGPYQGGASPEPVRAYVENADLVLLLGVAETDFNMGGFTAELRDERMIRARGTEVYVGREHFAQVQLRDLIPALRASLPPGNPGEALGKHFPHSPEYPYIPAGEQAIGNKRLFDRLAHVFRPGDVVTGDAGGLIESTYVEFAKGARFVGQAYWASIGWGFGAGVGASFAIDDSERVICIEGDGSFQMTAQEVSTLVRYGRKVIIVVLNNRGYTAERLIHEADYNDIQNWRFHELAAVFGGQPGAEVRTEGELETALAQAEQHSADGPFIINVHLDPMDASAPFKIMSERLRSRTAD